MRTTLMPLLSILCACASVPPQGTTDRLRYDARRDFIATCMAAPEQHGFPYTRAENVDLMSIDPRLSANVHTYCRRLAHSRIP